MERLTKRIDGEAVHFDCHGTCGTCDGCTCFEIGGMVDRLAAYEDTGLSPTDIAALTARAEAAEAERDAAVKDLKLALIDETLDPCHCCEYGRTNHCTHPDGPTCGETGGKNWQWRGQQAGKGEAE